MDADPATSPEAAWQHHKEVQRQDAAARLERATLASRLTQAIAERVLVLDVAGERVEARYPGKQARGEIVSVLAGARGLFDRLAQGEEPASSEGDALWGEVARLAAGLTLDPSLDVSFFSESEYGMELALGVLLAVEGALSARQHEAASFRADA